MQKKETDMDQFHDSILRKTLEKNPFLVPEGYFSTLQKDTIFKKNLSALGPTSFITPLDYQKSLTQDILSTIGENKIRELSPDAKFTVPEGYFEDLQIKILSKTTKNNGESELFIPKPLDTNHDKPIRRLGIYRWMPYVAAAIAIIISLFTILERNSLTTDSDPINYSAQIQSVPTDEIINYLAYYSEIGDLEYISEQIQDQSPNFIEGLSSQEIETYLEYSL